MPSFRIGDRTIGDDHPTYFIADIAANHDGSFERARGLIRLAKEAGADAAKFQHFRAPKIVSDYGFRMLGEQMGHQAKWQKSVYEVYEDASLPWEWTADLKACCDHEGIDFLSTPYDSEAVNLLDPYVAAYKVGSGDITWTEMLENVASRGKPLILSTGASNMDEVRHAVEAIRTKNPQFAILQCNTNYTRDARSFDYVHLNVLQSYKMLFPGAVLGLSDHTWGHAAVLGAVTLGARIIEKHFTDDPTRTGPDHEFSMTPQAWREMVERTRELERALGASDKFVTDNERETVIVQRRCIRAARNLSPGKFIERCDLEVLRPAPHGAILPNEIENVLGRRLLRSMKEGEHFTWIDFESEMTSGWKWTEREREKSGPAGSISLRASS